MYSLDEVPTVTVKSKHISYINPITDNSGYDNLFKNS